MRKTAMILVGIGFLILGGLWIFKDVYGENIAGAAEDIAVNLVAVKINQSLKKGFYDENFDGELLRVFTMKILTGNFYGSNGTKPVISST